MTGKADDTSVEFMTREQRAATVDLLTDLTDTEWTGPTMCHGWTVAHLAAHLSMPFRTGLPRLLVSLVAARGDFDRVADRLAKRDIERLDRSALVEVLRANTTTRWKVPGSDLTDSLCHDVIHGLDLTEGLGRPSTATSQQLLTVLETIEARNRARHFGVEIGNRTLAANDVDFTIGNGPTTTMPATTLIMTLTGRITLPD
jgi:uncharacterized protein (TIGR03083 family)